MEICFSPSFFVYLQKYHHIMTQRVTKSLKNEAYDYTFKLATKNEKLLTSLGFKGEGVPIALHSLMIAAYIGGCRRKNEEYEKNLKAKKAERIKLYTELKKEFEK